MSEHQEVLRKARERWMEGEADALPQFERGIGLALAAGDIPAALAAHQKLHRRRAERTVEALVDRLLSRGPELLGLDE
jgi:hypothetical protein